MGNICVANANTFDELVCDDVENDESINTRNDFCYSDYNYEVKFNQLASWNNLYNMQVDITNVGNIPIEDWNLIYFTEDEVENIWNASIVYKEDGLLYLSNAGWNKKIEPGETISFGYIAQYKDEYILPTNPLIIDNASEEEEMPDYTLFTSEETEYGTMYYVEQNGEIQTYTFWDVVDIIMAGASWADLFADPSLGNFGWAVLDTAALLPLLPSTAYFRKGGKVVLKSDEVAKAAANRGLVGKTNQTGIKKLTGKISGKYTHEIKVTGKYGAYRIYGYKKSNGQWIFDFFIKAHK